MHEDQISMFGIKHGAASRIERDFETFHPATDFQNPDSNLNENCIFWARKIKKVQVKKLKAKIF